jgi:hypothetical protein
MQRMLIPKFEVPENRTKQIYDFIDDIRVDQKGCQNVKGENRGIHLIEPYFQGADDVSEKICRIHQ